MTHTQPRAGAGGAGMAHAVRQADLRHASQPRAGAGGGGSAQEEEGGARGTGGMVRGVRVCDRSSRLRWPRSGRSAVRLLGVGVAVLPIVESTARGTNARTNARTHTHTHTPYIPTYYV